MIVEIAHFNAETGELRVYSREPGPQEVLATVDGLDSAEANELIAACRSLYAEGFRAGRAETIARVMTAVSASGSQP